MVNKSISASHRTQRPTVANARTCEADPPVGVGTNIEPLKDHSMKNLIARFAKNESGATAIEYGLIAGLIAVAIITAVGLVGTDVTAVFDTIAQKLNPTPA